MTTFQKYSIKELHKQFSPNIWNPKKDKIEIVMEHFRICADGTNKARQELSCTLDNSYGEKPSEKFDVYGTDLPSTCKMFIFVHGGGWQMGSKDLSGFFAPTLYKLGIRTVVLGYTLGPEGSVTNMIEQLKMGINTITKLYPDSEELIVSGHSAGAHLVSNLLHEEYLCTKLRKIVLFSGVYDLRGFYLTMFNKKAGVTAEESIKLSSILRTHINSSSKIQQTRVFVIVGKYEPPIFIEQATEYYQHLKSLGIQNCEFWLSENDDHFSIIETLGEATSPTTLRLQKFLNLPTSNSRL